MPSGGRLRVLAIDVGIANMAHCLISFPERGGARAEQRLAASPVDLARGVLAESSIVSWSRVSIGRGRGATTAEIIDMALTYFRRHREIFLSCDEAVIEQQPAARMRNVAVTLFALLRAEGVDVRFQSASQKLAFGADVARFLGEETVDSGQYRQRKLLGERLTRRFLGEHDHMIGHLQHFVAERKRDDLADSFLHCLARRCLARRPRDASSLGDGGENEPRKSPHADGALDDEWPVASEV